jgi:demethylmenaquinone methyltransferase / 2-methoxy-6-polyprenyl-1,4-benzoquinol methylase
VTRTGAEGTQTDQDCFADASARAASDGRTPALQAPHPPLRAYYPADESRQRFLTGLFDRTARQYHAIDRAAGLGSGRWYRRKALRDAGLRTGMRVLDVGCGSGLTTECAQALAGPTGRVVGLDPSMGMLREAHRAGCGALVQGIGEQLPLPDGSFEFLSMGYALRHLSDLRVAFREYHRVLAPGGVVLFLEISRPRSPALLSVARFYIRTIMGCALVVVTGNREMRTLMRYWWDTTEHCVTPETILAALREAGFAECDVKEQFSGLLRNYRAVKPSRDGAVLARSRPAPRWGRSHRPEADREPGRDDDRAEPRPPRR